MRLPQMCPACRTYQMVDMDNLVENPVDKLKTARGYVCEGCNQFTPLYYMTTSLRESLEKLKRYRHNHPDFYFHFTKTLKKAIGVNK